MLQSTIVLSALWYRYVVIDLWAEESRCCSKVRPDKASIGAAVTKIKVGSIIIADQRSTTGHVVHHSPSIYYSGYTLHYVINIVEPGVNRAVDA